MLRLIDETVVSVRVDGGSRRSHGRDDYLVLLMIGEHDLHPAPCRRTATGQAASELSGSLMAQRLRRAAGEGHRRGRDQQGGRAEQSEG
jgi:hypothetical protein